MQHVVAKSFGDPEHVLELAEAPLPEPKADEVRVRLVLSPIHNHDLMTIRGRYGYKPDLPYTPGTEALGVIDALGADVTGYSTGQRVAYSGQGLWSEYTTVKAQGLIPIPDAISDETAAQLISMPLSTLVLLKDLDVKPGDWVVQNAANGAVGKVMNFLAHSRGFNIINIVRRSSAIEDLKALGFSNVVATDTDDWKETAKAFAKGAPISRGLDSVTGEATNDLMDILSNDAELITFGSMSGDMMKINPSNVLFKNIKISGFWAARRIPEVDGNERQQMVGDLFRLAAEGKLPLPVDQILSLSDAGKGAALTVAPGRNGKILLKP